MSTKAVRVILETRLGTWAAAQVPPLRVTYENVAFTPNTGETYIRASLLPAPTQSQDLQGTHRAYLGVFQASIVRPKGAGSGPALDLAASLNTQFPVNGRYTSGTVTVQITRPASVAPALVDDSEYVVPVSIWYRADTI